MCVVTECLSLLGAASEGVLLESASAVSSPKQPERPGGVRVGRARRAVTVLAAFTGGYMVERI